MKSAVNLQHTQGERVCKVRDLRPQHVRKGYGAGGEKTGEELGAVSAVSVWGGEGRGGKAATA